MITIENFFTKNEKRVIDVIARCLELHFGEIPLNGKVIDTNGSVQFEVYIGDEDARNLLILRVSVRDRESTPEGFCNFLSVSSIYIPKEYSHNFLGTTLLLLLAKTAMEMGFAFFVTCIVNEWFFNYLLELGGIVDYAGDIELYYPDMLKNLLTKEAGNSHE